MNARLHADALATEATVPLTLDGQPVLARPNETIWQLAQRLGQTIPHLCHSDGLRPDGNCRACVVEVAGERTLSASCCRVASPGLDVHTQSERAVKSRALVLELLLADTAHAQPAPEALALPATPPLGELSAWAKREGVTLRPTLAPSALPATRPAQPTDNSHPAMVVNLDACIQCTRCVRACRESQVNDVIGLAGRGSDARIVFDLGDPMGASSCR
jgi:formate dehydrogenase major subunit